MNTIIRLIKRVVLIGLFAMQATYAEPLYFLCGSDEDGCIQGHEEDCICIPLHAQPDNQPYCLDFDSMTCQLLSDQPNCNPALIFPNQAACISTRFQSEPYPPCKTVTESYCNTHTIQICDEICASA